MGKIGTNVMIEFINLSKKFTTSQGEISILEDVNLKIETAKKIAILGKSGSGKSTLLNLICGLMKPDSGKIIINNQDLSQLTEDELSDFRAKNLGIVFQQFHLIPAFTALENVQMPLEILNKKELGFADELLKAVGLSERSSHYPVKLSGGEQQRVAIARSLVHDPLFILADEPSGNLDIETGKMVMDLFFKLISDKMKTMILVTHDHELAQLCDEVYEIKNKKLLKK
jgi:putative ABC transport system ATP-binding protein